MNDITPSPAEKDRSLTGRTPAPDAPLGWLRNEIDRLFDDFGRPARGLFDFAGRGIAPLPALEMREEDSQYRLTAELPGMKEDEVSLQVADGLLVLSGEKKEEQERREAGLLLNERRYGTFERRVPLPDDVDPDRVAARFKEGVLTVILGKDEKAASRTRKIPIQKA